MFNKEKLGQHKNDKTHEPIGSCDFNHTHGDYITFKCLPLKCLQMASQCQCQ